MYYTIATMEDLSAKQSLKINKNGNKYDVCLYDRDISKFTRKTFATIEEAEQAFLKIASCFIHGVYSAKDRAKMLLDC